MLLFELLIGALWAPVSVLSLMVKQAVVYVSARAAPGEQGAGV